MKIYLDKPERITSQIVMVFSYNKKSYKFFPSISIKVKDWDSKKYKAKGEEGWIVNEKILEMQKVIRGILFRMEEARDPNPSQKNMALIILNEMNPKKSKKEDLNFFVTFVEDYRNRKQSLMSESLYRKFNTMIEDVSAINPLLKFSEIDGNFLNKYIQHLFVKGNIHNTVHGKIKKIKQMCLEAMKYGVEVNRNFGDVKISEQKNHPVYLLWDEVEALEKLPPNIYLDAFLFRCYTGVRFSDMKNMNPDSILKSGNHKTIPIFLAKQRKKHKIFLPEKAYEIWKRNNFKFSDQYLQPENREIKEFAKTAKLKRNIQTIQYSLQKPSVKIKPIHEIISTHMARRTFARRWFDQGGNLNLLRDYLGHASLNTTLHYIGIESEEANEEASRIFS